MKVNSKQSLTKSKATTTPMSLRSSQLYTLSKYPGGNPIFHRGLKLNSTLLWGKYEKD